MKTISPELETHITAETTTLATCWKLTRRDAVVMGFTDHDQDITYASVTYQASSGFTPSAVANSATLSVDNLDIEGVLDSTTITEADILAGIYDFAEVEVFKLNYADTTQGALLLRRGWLGEVSMNQHQFVAEIRGLTQRLSQSIGELYAPACRAGLGDGRCKVNLAPFTVTGTLTSVTSNQVFSDDTRMEAAGFFTFGKITFTSGNNNGLSMEVKEFAQGEIILVLPMPYAVQTGDAYTMIAGCDKSFETCKNRFTNAINFRGEPHVPGTDRILETAGTRNSL